MFDKNIYLESLNYIYLSNETIKTKYILNLLHNSLIETYSKLDIKPQNIKASLLTILYQCKQEGDLSNDHIIDLLNTEFLKINMTFNIDISNKKLIYPRSGIIEANAYEDGLLEINIKPVFLDILRSIDLTKTSNQFLNWIVEDLMKVYSHEYTHKNQFEKQEKRIPGINSNDITNKAQTKKYLSHQREIDSHAREAATELLLSGKSANVITDYFLSQSGDEQLIRLSKNYGIYWQLFGLSNYTKSKTKQDLKDIQIFNKFKKRIYDFLLLDKEFINKDDLITILKNKKK